LMVPAATTMLKGTNLTNSAQMVNDQLSLARQRALSKNRLVEVRFYRYGDPETPGEKANDPSTGKYHALQVFEIDPQGKMVALGKMQQLQQSIIIDSGQILSSILHQAGRAAQKGSAPAP